MCNWGGYMFNIYNLEGTHWNAVAGVYIFASSQYQQWRAVYIGQTDSFANRLPNHEQRSNAISYGATHIHVLAEPNLNLRETIERHLIHTYQPFLNQR